MYRMYLVGAMLLTLGMAATVTATPRRCHDEGGRPLTDVDVDAVCAARAEGGHGVAICGGIVATDVEARAKAICGAAVADCEGGDLFLKLSVVEDACSQAQEMAASATLTAGDTAVTCGNAAQTCGDVAVSCPPAPQCPNVQPACAKWRYRYTRKGAIKGQKCLRWVTPVVDLR